MEEETEVIASGQPNQAAGSRRSVGRRARRDRHGIASFRTENGGVEARAEALAERIAREVCLERETQDEIAGARQPGL